MRDEQELVEVAVKLRVTRATRDAIAAAAAADGLTLDEAASFACEVQFDARTPWENLPPEVQTAFTEAGIPREDVEARLGGRQTDRTDFSLSESDRKFAESYAEVKRQAQLPATYIHPDDICVSLRNGEYCFTVPLLMTDEQEREVGLFWLGQPAELRRAAYAAGRQFYHDTVEPRLPGPGATGSFLGRLAQPVKPQPS